MAGLLTSLDSCWENGVNKPHPLLPPSPGPGVPPTQTLSPGAQGLQRVIGWAWLGYKGHG